MAAKVKRTTYLLLASGFALSTCIDSTHAVAAAHSVVVAQDDRHPSSNLTSTADRISGSTEERVDTSRLSIVKKLMARLDCIVGGSSYKPQLQASIYKFRNMKSEPGTYSLSHSAAKALYKEPDPEMSPATLTDLQYHLRELWYQEHRGPREVYSFCGLNANSPNIFFEWGFSAWASYVSHHYKKRVHDWNNVMLKILRLEFNDDVKLSRKIIKCIENQDVDDVTRNTAEILRTTMQIKGCWRFSSPNGLEHPPRDSVSMLAFGHS